MGARRVIGSECPFLRIRVPYGFRSRASLLILVKPPRVF